MHSWAGALLAPHHRETRPAKVWTDGTALVALEEASQSGSISVDEYNHIARVHIKLAEIEKAQPESESENEDNGEAEKTQWASPTDPAEASVYMEDGAVYFDLWPEGPIIHPADETPKTPPKKEYKEPDLVMLDGTAASGLEQAKEQLTPEEFEHIQKVQRRLAELAEEEQRVAAMMSRPIILDSPLGPSRQEIFEKYGMKPPAPISEENCIETMEEGPSNGNGITKSSTNATKTPSVEAEGMQIQRKQSSDPLVDDKPYANLFGFTT
eukprot:m.40686 g.40686  ORF g.40686 m.40686 type:complete len:268 (-) comp9693_c0_seq2:117-920(-)